MPSQQARLVNQKVVVPTTIVHMRSLPAQAYLPLRSRLRPVETTVWGLDAILLRYKVEEDSDVHLVIADTGGHAMITEITAPQCVGASMGRDVTIATLTHGHASPTHPERLWALSARPASSIPPGTRHGHSTALHAQSGAAGWWDGPGTCNRRGREARQL
jgi:hypothetical protein